ncbi:hypothetical protein RJT34_15977 [Clitoria ternatea]|uniref:Secreted protein n=1 Tax=Clitoria ternatea TaxID=43366 RepID=A0AAN9J7W2_CLITE
MKAQKLASLLYSLVQLPWFAPLSSTEPLLPLQNLSSPLPQHLAYSFVPVFRCNRNAFLKTRTARFFHFFLT